jgi:hypothetical protein
MTDQHLAEIPAYPPTERSRRAKRVARHIPSFAGLGAVFICARQEGLITASVAALIGVTIGFAILLMGRRAQARRAATLERAGHLLVTRVRFDLGLDGRIFDFNHRRGTASERDADSYEGVFDSTAQGFRITSLRKRQRVTDLDVAWADVSSAEVLPRSKNWCELVVQTRTAARYRAVLRARPDHVRAMLTGLAVGAVSTPIAPSVSVGDRVRAGDGREGEVVAVVAREHDPGHLEIFVRLPDSVVESWDSAGIEVLH